MTSDFVHYIQRGFRVGTAWRLAFGVSLGSAIAAWAMRIAIILLLTWGAIQVGNLHFEAVEAAKQEQAAYVKALEQVVARCLSDGTGRPIIIDGQTHLCGVYPLGI